MSKTMSRSILMLMGALMFAGFAAAQASPAAGNDRILRTREFVVMGYRGICSDLESKQGPYLETLLDLIGTGKDRQEEMIEKLRSLAARHSSNIMDFADEVAALAPSGEMPREAAAMVAPPAGPGIVSGAGLENAIAHLTRGRAVTIYLKNGEQLRGTFEDFDSRRLWIRGASRRSVPLGEVLAVGISS